MKRNQIMFLVVIVFVIMSVQLSAVVVIDSLYNVTGDWVINDSVYVTQTGIIQNSGNYTTLTINGGLSNHGIIRDNPGGYYLYLEVGGNLANYNEWSCYKTYLTGAGAQHISCGVADYFSSSHFYNDTGGNIIALTSLNFLNCQIDFQNNGALDLSEGGNLSIDGGYIYRTTIIGEPIAGRGLYMTNGAYIHSVSASYMKLSGITNIADSGVLFTGSLINNGIIQNSGNYNTLTIDCDITNNGTIKNNSSGYYLYLDITGDIINNGDWTNNDIELTGTTDQHISCPSDSSFSVSHFFGNDTRANIYFDSDIEFENTNINLNDDNVILQSGMTLSLSGGYLFNGSLTGSAAVMNMTGGNYIHDLTINVDDLDLYGICQIADNGVIINGAVINYGYLQNISSYHTLIINGDLTNNGTIRNNPGGYTFSLDINGDIINNGDWTNNDIELTGSGQHITCGAGSTFDTAAFYGNGSARGDVYFDSDIGFNGVYINLNDDNAVLQSGMILSMSGGQMFNGTLTGTTATINMTGGNYIHALTISVDDLVLSGNCLIADNGVSMNGDVVNNGYLQNVYGNYTLYLNEDFTNNGTVRNNPGGYTFYMDINGDIVNNGSWTNTRNYVNGTIDQTITIENPNEITADVRFDSDIAVAPYQWRFNGSNLNDPDFVGETGSQLDWEVPVASGWFGTFDCDTGGGLSRNIIVIESGAAPDTPQNLTIEISGGNVNLDWDDAAGATSYTVYSDTDPYGTFTTNEGIVAVSEWSEAIPTDIKYYRVTASN